MQDYFQLIKSFYFQKLHVNLNMTSYKAILFDMDGVLAEVSQSYRTAIILTAEKFNVFVTAQDIEAEKRKGNANNDWVRIIAHLITLLIDISRH